MRFFDPSNQRSREDTSEVHVGPVHTLIPDEESLEQGLQRLLNSCEERGVEKRVRQRLVDDFKHRVRFPGAECYLPYFFPNLQSLLDYIPADSVLVLPDADTLGHTFEDLQEEIFRGWESASQEGLPIPRPEELYLSPDEFTRGVARFRTVTMSPLEIENPQSRSFRIDCQTNSDIRPDLLRTKGYDAGMGKLVKRLEGWRDDGNEVFLVSHTLGQAHRLLKLLEPYSLNLDFRGGPLEQSSVDSSPVPGIRLYVGALSSGFRMAGARRIVLTEEEVFGARVRTPPKRRARGSLISSLTDLAEGEPVVHEDYGIGIFRGLSHMEFDGIPGEVMVVEYAGGDLLYHPVQRLQVAKTSRFEAPSDSRLGGRDGSTQARSERSIRKWQNSWNIANRQVAQGPFRYG
jgi:transcription-repair coupling factor (superfamily II helicase)